MTSKELIKQTVKYVNEGNGTKYYAGVYDKNSPNTPIAIYTLYDIFDTVQNISSDMVSGLSKFPAVISNLKASLNLIGYTALDKTFNSLKTSLTAIESVQKIIKAYRIVKPVVKKAVNIGGLMWNFANMAEIAQDIAQLLMRSSVLAIRTALLRLWDDIIQTPIFALYDREITDLSSAQQTANELIEDCLAKLFTDDSIWDDVIKFTNDYLCNNNNYTSASANYNRGTVFDDDIIDVCYYVSKDLVYVADINNNIYLLDNDKPNKIFTANETIKKIFVDKGNLFYQSGNKIYSISKNSKGEYKNSSQIKAFDSQDLKYIYKNDSVLIAENQTIYAIYNNTINTSINVEKNIRQCLYSSDGRIIFLSDNNEIYEIINNSIINLIASVDKEIEMISFFDGYIYAVINENGEYSLKKINATITFNEYKFKDDSKEDPIHVSLFTDKYVSSAKEIQTWKVEDGAIQTRTEMSALPLELTSLTSTTVDGQEFLIGFNAFSLTISRKNIESWKVRPISFEDGIENEAFISSAWCNGDFYFASQRHVFKIENGTDNYKDIFYGFSDITLDKLPETKRSPNNEREAWKPGDADDLPMTGLYYDKSFEVPSGYNINRLKTIDGKLYVSMYRSVADFENCEIVKETKRIEELILQIQENEEKTQIEKDAEIEELRKTDVESIVSNKVISGEIKADSGLFVIDNDEFKKKVDFKEVKAYSFEKKNGTWYIANTTEFFRITDELKKISQTAIDENSERNEAIIDIFIDEEEKINICLSNTLLVEKDNSDLIDIETNVKKNVSNKEIYSTDNGLMMMDNSFIYNIIGKLSSGTVTNDEEFEKYISGYKDKELYQIVMKADDYKLIPSAKSIFIVNDNVLKTINRNSAMVSEEYHCGYFTDTTPNKWAGAAPYYFASNVLNNSASEFPKSQFITDFRGSFMNELDILLKSAPLAYTSFIKNKLKEELNKNRSEFVGIPDVVLDTVIESATSTASSNVAMYIKSYFAEKVGDSLTYDKFASDVVMACMRDKTNNMTKDFYDVFKNILKDLTRAALSAYNAVALEDWLITYYQRHKHEWCKSITDLTDVDIIDSSVYINEENIKSGLFIAEDENYHDMFYASMLSLKEKIENIVRNKFGAITSADKENISAELGLISYTQTPSEIWQDCIRDSVKVYSKKQCESYQNIVTESNMYPIKWDELPERIDKEAFDKALNILLDIIKKSINDKIYVLVEEGKVKCFSCVDATGIINYIKKINNNLYKKQFDEVKKMLLSATDYSEINLDNIVPEKIIKDTETLFIKSIKNQTELFAKYINEIVVEETINTTAEVEM